MSKATEIKNIAQGNWRIAMGRCEEQLRSVIAKSSDEFEDVEAVYELEDESALLILGEDNITSYASFPEAMDAWKEITAAKKQAVNNAYWGGPTPENVCPDCGLIHDDDDDVEFDEPTPERGFQCEDGHVRIYADGQGYLLSHVIWQQEHGPLPEGYTIRHINGNLLDNRLHNLEAVSTAGALK